MEAAVKWVVIFSLAFGAHSEMTHGRPRAVIGYILDYGKAGSAVGTVGEGVTIAPVAGG